MSVKKLTYKCPDCGLPWQSLYGATGLQMFGCTHMTAAKPTVEEARSAWNVLATSAWQRKSTISTVAGPSDSPSSTVRG